MQAILKIIPKYGNFLDIGANIGWYSLIIAKFCKKLKIHSFEPIKKNYIYLLKNIKCNSLKNIKAYNFGFYNKNKKIFFYTYQEGGGNSSIQNLSERKNVELQSCNVRVLDDFINKKKIKVDFIKCDVEGAELFVFLGAKKVLYCNKPIVFCEMLRKWCKKFEYHPNQIILFFKSFGYQCFSISYSKNCANINRSSVFYKKFKLKEVKIIDNKTKETNFLFMHIDKHQKIIKKFI